MEYTVNMSVQCILQKKQNPIASLDILIGCYMEAQGVVTVQFHTGRITAGELRPG